MLGHQVDFLVSWKLPGINSVVFRILNIWKRLRDGIGKEIIKKSGDRTESSIVSFAERILEPSLISMAVAKWSITASKWGNNGVKCKC